MTIKELYDSLTLGVLSECLKSNPDARLVVKIHSSIDSSRDVGADVTNVRVEITPHQPMGETVLLIEGPLRKG